jgi:hypothetical protein
MRGRIEVPASPGASKSPNLQVVCGPPPWHASSEHECRKWGGRRRCALPASWRSYPSLPRASRRSLGPRAGTPTRSPRLPTHAVPSPDCRPRVPSENVPLVPNGDRAVRNRSPNRTAIILQAHRSGSAALRTRCASLFRGPRWHSIPVLLC